MVRSLVLRSLPILAFLAGCGGAGGASSTGPEACTEIGCASGVTLDFSAPLRATGKYTVRVDADGQQTTCEATLPFAGCASEPACSSPDVLLGQSGCALPASEHSLTGLQLPTKTPSKVTVTIERDGQPVATQTFDLTYTTSRPNGPDCEPVCKQASGTIAVP